MKKLYWKIRAFLRKHGKEKQTCPRRMDDYGPWERKENLDYWDIEKNGDRTCSFCGSLHPSDFEKCIELCLSDVEKCQIDPSYKGYKIYVRRPEIHNAGDGGIKFYTQHCRGLSKKHCEEIQPQLNKAIRLSKQRWESYIKKRRQDSINEANSAKEGTQ